MLDRWYSVTLDNPKVGPLPSLVCDAKSCGNWIACWCYFYCAVHQLPFCSTRGCISTGKQLPFSVLCRPELVSATWRSHMPRTLEYKSVPYIWCLFYAHALSYPAILRNIQQPIRQPPAALSYLTLIVGSGLLCRSGYSSNSLSIRL